MDRTRIYCVGCEELPTILTEIRDKKIVDVRDDLLRVCTNSDNEIAQGDHGPGDIMRYSPGTKRFRSKGLTPVDPYTFAFAWLGYIPEPLRARAKSRVFCKGSPEVEPILTAIRKNEGWGPFPMDRARDPKYEFSESTIGSGAGIAYNEGPYFGTSFKRTEVSHEVFAAIWLGTKTAANAKHVDADVPGPSRSSVTITAVKLQIKL